MAESLIWSPPVPDRTVVWSFPRKDVIVENPLWSLARLSPWSLVVLAANCELDPLPAEPVATAVTAGLT